MRNREDMNCFKWHKNDRICFLCPYEVKCKFELDLYLYTDELFSSCRHRSTFKTGGVFYMCKKEDVVDEFCTKERCILDCHSKEIKKFKRNYKLKKIR